MDFGEAMDLVKRGSRVRADNWKNGLCIELDESGMVSYNKGTAFFLNEEDLDDEWHIYHELTEGTKLTDAGDCSSIIYDAVIVKQDDGLYQIVDTTRWKVISGDISQSDLPDIIKYHHYEKKN